MKLNTHNCAARAQGARRRPRGLGPGLELVLCAEQTLVCSLARLDVARKKWRSGGEVEGRDVGGQTAMTARVVDAGYISWDLSSIIWSASSCAYRSTCVSRSYGPSALSQFLCGCRR